MIPFASVSGGMASESDGSHAQNNALFWPLTLPMSSVMGSIRRFAASSGYRATMFLRYDFGNRGLKCFEAA